MEAFNIKTVCAALHEACFSPSASTKREMLVVLEQFQSHYGYMEYLVRVIDINDLGSSMHVDCRLLAAVLLKNLYLKRSTCDATSTELSDEMEFQDSNNRPLSIDEKSKLKSFLCSYHHDPECKVSLQLSLLIAKIARRDGDYWLREWPELIPALLAAIQGRFVQGMSEQSHSQPNAGAPNNNGTGGNNSSSDNDTSVDIACQCIGPSNGKSGSGFEYGIESISTLRSLRAFSTLFELLSELSNNVSSSSTSFNRGFSKMCCGFYIVVCRLFCENMKKLGCYLSKLNRQAASLQHMNERGYNVGVEEVGISIADQITGGSGEEVEGVVVHLVLIVKTIRLILEYGFQDIVARYSTFKGFWKGYLGNCCYFGLFVSHLFLFLKQQCAFFLR
jgi:hypothetical protein